MSFVSALSVAINSFREYLAANSPELLQLFDGGASTFEALQRVALKTKFPHDLSPASDLEGDMHRLRVHLDAYFKQQWDSKGTAT